MGDIKGLLIHINKNIIVLHIVVFFERLKSYLHYQLICLTCIRLEISILPIYTFKPDDFHAIPQSGEPGGKIEPYLDNAIYTLHRQGQ